MSTDRQPSLAQLFATFLRLGITSFGGPTMIAYIRATAVEKKHWLDAQVFGEGVALCQMIPGATAMQTAAYVGLTTRGIAGAGVSYVGFALPAFLLMTTLSVLYARHHSVPVVVAAFGGLQAIVIAIMANATWSFGRATIRNWSTLVLAGAAALLLGLRASPLLVLLLAALAGATLLRPETPLPDVAAATRKSPSSAKPLLCITGAAVSVLPVLFWYDPKLLDLALLMIRIDLCAFGGGFATVPLMLHEVVEARQWLDGPTFMNGIVLGQVTPGPIVITATFVGHQVGGLWGAVVATIGVFLPSFVVLVGVAPYFDRLRTSPVFQRVVSGVLCSFVGLLLAATVRFAGDVAWDLPHGLLAAGALVALLAKIDILWVVLIGTLISLAV
jgi:chromate transporter